MEPVPDVPTEPNGEADEPEEEPGEPDEPDEKPVEPDEPAELNGEGALDEGPGEPGELGANVAFVAVEPLAKVDGRDDPVDNPVVVVAIVAVGVDEPVRPVSPVPDVPEEPVNRMKIICSC